MLLSLVDSRRFAVHYEALHECRLHIVLLVFEIKHERVGTIYVDYKQYVCTRFSAKFGSISFLLTFIFVSIAGSISVG